MQTDNIIKDIKQAIFANICMDLQYAYKYEEEKKKNKDRKGKEIGKRKVRSGYSRSVPVIESIPVFKRTASVASSVQPFCFKGSSYLKKWVRYSYKSYV